jgi:hypothetical protein
MLHWYQWFTPILLVTVEAEIRRIVVPCQPKQIVLKTPSPNNWRRMDWRCDSSIRMPVF